METIKHIDEKIMLVRTHTETINFRGSLFNASRKWWWVPGNKNTRADYVMVDVDGVVQEVYKPSNWHKEIDTGKDLLKFKTERWVFAEKDDGDDGEYCKSFLAPDSIRKKYIGKLLEEPYRKGSNPQNPVRYSF